MMVLPEPELEAVLLVALVAGVAGGVGVLAGTVAAPMPFCRMRTSLRSG